MLLKHGLKLAYQPGLAAGVNKNLLIAIADDQIRYLQLERPPSDRRWTNIHRR